jgi:hypothetical protein
MKSLTSILACYAFRVTLAAAIGLAICLPFGCQKKVEKTIDPDKMEQVRQEHVKRSQREMQQSREAQRKKP